MSRSAVEVVDLYNFELWNRMRPELLSEICAGPLERALFRHLHVDFAILHDFVMR